MGEASDDCLLPKRGFPLPDLPHAGGGALTRLHERPCMRCQGSMRSLQARMPCPIYTDQRLAACYDAANPPEAFYAHYLALADDAPKTILDMGSGTGRLAVALTITLLVTCSGTTITCRSICSTGVTSCGAI